MRDTIIIAIIGATIATLLLLIVILFLASIIRRAFNERKYRKLDRLREHYSSVIRAALEAGDIARLERECAARPNSHAWQAVEDALLGLMNNERYQRETKQFLSRFGYISHHETGWRPEMFMRGR